MKDAETYYSIEEVAKMLKVSYLTVYRWIKANKINAVRAGKQYRISSSSLEQYLSRK